MMRFVRYCVFVFTALLFGLLSASADAQDQPFYVTYSVDSENSLCDTQQLWLAHNVESNLPDDVMVVSVEWMNSSYINYSDAPGDPGYNSNSGWFIRDGYPIYPYTYTKYLAYYSPSDAMPVFRFWFTLTCDNGVATVSMQEL